MSDLAKKKKTPVWVIVVAVLVGLGVIGTLTTKADAPAVTPQADTQDNKPAAAAEPKVPWIDAGTFKVGTDLPQGEYLLAVNENESGYFEVDRDSKGKLDSIIANDNFTTSSFVTVKDGEYLKIRGARALSVKDFQNIGNGKEWGPGQYRIGKDIPAGEYKVTPSGDGYFEVSKNSRHSMLGIVSNENFSEPVYVTVSEGQYLKLVNASILSK